jgi:hypothetical protein
MVQVLVSRSAWYSRFSVRRGVYLPDTFAHVIRAMRSWSSMPSALDPWLAMPSAMFLRLRRVRLPSCASGSVPPRTPFIGLRRSRTHLVWPSTAEVILINGGRDGACCEQDDGRAPSHELCSKGKRQARQVGRCIRCLFLGCCVRSPPCRWRQRPARWFLLAPEPR